MQTKGEGKIDGKTDGGTREGRIKTDVKIDGRWEKNRKLDGGAEEGGKTGKSRLQEGERLIPCLVGPLPLCCEGSRGEACA